MSKTNGRTAAPAAVAEYPCTWIRFIGNRKKKIPMAAYKNKVSKLVPPKLRDSKREKGTIGDVTRRSTNTNAMRPPTPTIKLPKTSGFLQPKVTDSMKPLTKPPSPRVANSAPHQSIRLAMALRLSGIRQTEIAVTTAASG